MGRQEAIARSIVLAILNGFHKRANSALSFILSLFSIFFSLYQLPFEKIRPADFANLRRNHWKVEDNAYFDSFRSEDGEKAEDALKPIGDMGYSGSVCVLLAWLPFSISPSLTIAGVSADFLRHG